MCFDFHYQYTKSLRIDLGKDFEDILCSQPNQINNKYKKSQIVFFFTGFTAVLFLVTLKIKFKNKTIKTINVNRSINKSHILVVLMKSECSKYKCKYFTYFTLCEIRRLTYRSLIFSILPGDVTTSFFSYFSV